MALLLPPPSTFLQFDQVSAVNPLVSGRGLLRGLAVEESTGAVAARFLVLDGANAQAPLMVPVRLKPGETRLDTIGSEGWLFQRGLFVAVTAGSVNGALAVMLEEEMTIEQHQVIFGESGSGWYREVEDNT